MIACEARGSLDQENEESAVKTSFPCHRHVFTTIPIFQAAPHPLYVFVEACGLLVIRLARAYTR